MSSHEGSGARRVIWSAVLGLALLSTPAWSSDPIAYITEIHRKGPGTALITRTGATDGRPALPLLPLRRGDEIRATGDVEVVLLYHAGTGTQTVSRRNSPFVVEALPSAPTNDRLRILVASVGQVFLNQQSIQGYKRMSVRSIEPPLVAVSPRRTRLLPGPVTFEWQGGQQVSYDIRVLGPDGVVWDRKDVRALRVAYPANAARLVDGVQYSWEIRGPGQPAQRTDFELISDAEAKRVSDALGALQRAAREGYSSGTVPLMRAAILLDESLYADARRELQAAIETNGSEPAYHLLLAYVYQRVGLAVHASDAVERALSLSELDTAASKP